MNRPKLERDALTRMRAAYLDLQSAKRYSEANDLLDIIERIDPPLVGDGLASRAGRSAVGDTPPVSSAPTTYRVREMDWYGGKTPCRNCGKVMAAHCTTHLLPCCPGSLMHGQDEGTWTPTTAHR